MNTIKLTHEENEQIEKLLNNLMTLFCSPCESDFLLHARLYANDLPQSLLYRINEFRYTETHNGTLLISGFYIDDMKIGPTPHSVGKEIDETSAQREGFMLMLLISLLGDAFGWDTQRDGALINNILPVKGNENEQLSTGSIANLDWHTEEAFHPFRSDYLALMCLRNPDNVPTLLGSVQDIHIEPRVKKVLFEPRFCFLTDKNFSTGSSSESEHPEPVLFGDFDNPYIRIDPSFMASMDGDTEAHESLQLIIDEFQKFIYNQVLQQGDILFIDNFRVVHGRKGFLPRFDGNDRWLKRVNITSDLRKSRVLRESHNSRIIITY